MSKYTLLHLNALIEAIEKIELYTADFDNSDDFYHEQKSFDASMMQFVLIGEVITRLKEIYKLKKEIG